MICLPARSRATAPAAANSSPHRRAQQPVAEIDDLTDGKPVGAHELVFKSTGGYPMATKASGTFMVLIIEK